MGERANAGRRGASGAGRRTGRHEDAAVAGRATVAGRAADRPDPGAVDRAGTRRGNKPFQRSMNRALVLNDLRRAPGASRAELAGRLALDRSTISNITGELIGAGLIEEIAGGGKPAPAEGRPVPKAGRRAVGLRIADERLCALGVEIDARDYRAIVLDNSGAVRYREEGEHDFVSDTATAIVETVAAVASRADEHGARVIGAGCAIPGYVSPAEARIVYSRELGVVEAQLYGRAPVDVRRRGAAAADGGAPDRGNSPTGIPIVYDNDANCCAWGEIHAGAMSGRVDDLLFVLAKVGVAHLGIGFGLAIDGEVRSGATHSAGEFYSREWSGDERTQLSIAASDLTAVRENAAMRRAFLIELLSNLIPVASVLDPAAVVFGGVLREYFEETRALVASDFSAGYLGRIASRIRRSTLADDEMAAGAAALVLERLFRIPRYGTGDDAAAIRWEDVAKTLGEAV